MLQVADETFVAVRCGYDGSPVLSLSQSLMVSFNCTPVQRPIASAGRGVGVALGAAVGDGLGAAVGVSVGVGVAARVGVAVSATVGVAVAAATVDVGGGTGVIVDELQPATATATTAATAIRRQAATPAWAGLPVTPDLIVDMSSPPRRSVSGGSGGTGRNRRPGILSVVRPQGQAGRQEA
jgi:hypothetical protein